MDDTATSGRRKSAPDEGDPSKEGTAEALRERIYATFTGLAIVLVQNANVEHVTAIRATFTLLIGIVAITVAGLVADVMVHLSVHSRFPRGREFTHLVRISGTAIASAGAPLVVLLLAVFDILKLETALTIASVSYLVVLGLIGYFAVRRTRAAWWKQIAALGVLVTIGLVVIIVQQIAHGH